VVSLGDADTTFGWPLLEHQYRTLVGRSLPIHEDQLVDFHAALAHEYGPDFVPRPRFLNLVKRNGLTCPELLHGVEEALAHRRGDYQQVSRSTGKKVETLGQLLVRYVRRKLVTGLFTPEESPPLGHLAEKRRTVARAGRTAGSSAYLWSFPSNVVSAAGGRADSLTKKDRPAHVVACSRVA